jgi:AcrR family transcriptional regulator
MTVPAPLACCWILPSTRYETQTRCLNYLIDRRSLTNGQPLMTTSSTPLPRQARADDTRWRVFSAGAELFAEQGYHATSVQQIATRAGVGKGTFFVYFPTKDAVVTEMVQMLLRIVRKEHERLVAGGERPLARLRATVLALGMLSDRNVTRAVVTAGLDNPRVGGAIDLLFHDALEWMADDVREAVRAGDLPERTNTEALALVIMDSFLGAAVSYATNPRGRSLIEMLESLVDTNLAHARLSTATTTTTTRVSAT